MNSDGQRDGAGGLSSASRTPFPAAHCPDGNSLRGFFVYTSGSVPLRPEPTRVAPTRAPVGSGFPFFSTFAHFSHIPPLNESVDRLFNGGGAVCSVKLLRLNGAERRRCVILTAGNFRSASLFSVLKRHRPARTVRPGLFTDSGRSTVAAPASVHRSVSPPLPPLPRCFSERVFGARSCLGGNFFRLFLVTAHFSLWRCDVTPLLFPLCAPRPLLSPPHRPLLNVNLPPVGLGSHRVKL